MSDCSNSVTKYIIVQPPQSGGGEFSGLTVCGGGGIAVDFITGCTVGSDVNVNGAIFNDGTLTVPTINATLFSGGTFYGDGSNLTGLPTTIDSYMTGGTYSNGFITFSGVSNFSNVVVDVQGLVNTYVSGGTFDGISNRLILDYNNKPSLSINIESFSGITILTDGVIVPDVDNTGSVGTPLKRFRDINTVNGTSSHWTSTTAQITTLSATTINLGLDSGSELRIITADTSIIKNDCLDSGTY